MTTRFIAFAWDERDARGTQRAATLRQSLTETPAWTAMTDRAQLAVYISHHRHSASSAISLDQDAGVILGTLFERSSSSSTSLEGSGIIENSHVRAILRSQGRSLIHSHWGSYVLLLRHEEAHRIHILRGPTGTLPCYYLTDHGVTVFVSHAADLQWLCPGRLAINWDSIRAQAAAGDYLTRETGLMGVSAMLSGECLDIYEGRITHHTFWNPAQVCRDTIKHLPDAATVLQQQTHYCVSARASQHQTLLLLLSGGLDSSIVLSCLRRGPAKPRVIAVNFYSPGAGDERRFARSMAARTQTRLEEVASNLHIDLRKFQHCALTASPELNFTAFDVEPVVRRLAERWNATAVFTGETGDDVLGHAFTPEALSEILQRPAQWHRFFSAALDYAELTRISVWCAMRLAIRHLFWLHRIETWSVYRHRQRTGQARTSSLISDAAADHYETMIPRFVHPWFQAADGLPLGKAMLLYSLIKATSSMSEAVFDETGALPTIHPLTSQPLVEAVLRMPSHLHFYRAENGAVARTAFRDALSPEVLERGTGKGRPQAWARSLVDTNAAFLSELLLEGVLVRQGILDRAKIEALLSKDVNRTQVGVAELIRQVYIELWLRRWAQAGARL